jgi:hypothetical protein
MQHCDLKVRVTEDLKARLAARAAANGRSLNGEAVTILGGVLGPAPTVVVVRECITPTERFWTANFDGQDDFYDGVSEDDAYAATLSELKKRGLRLGDVQIKGCTEHLPSGAAASLNS